MVYQPTEEDKAFYAPGPLSRLTMHGWVYNKGRLEIEFHFWTQVGQIPSNRVFQFLCFDQDLPLPPFMNVRARTWHRRVLRVGQSSPDTTLRTVQDAPWTLANSFHKMELTVIPRNMPAAAGETVTFLVTFPQAMGPFRMDGLWSDTGNSLVLKLPNPSNPSGPPNLVVPMD